MKIISIIVLLTLIDSGLSIRDSLHLFTHKKRNSIFNKYSNSTIARKNKKYPMISFNQ